MGSNPGSIMANITDDSEMEAGSFFFWWHKDQVYTRTKAQPNGTQVDLVLYERKGSFT
jgi:hypothetical protein